MTRGFDALAAAASACASPPAAEAATPFTIGSGSFPDVAVDAGGTTHIVYDQHDPTGDHIGYCQVPKGNTSCATGPHTPLTAPAEAIGLSTYVFAPPPERIVIISPHCYSPDA